MISAILAVSKNNIIGKNGNLPWPFIKEDMEWFKEKTANQVVVMGSKSWWSPDMPKPLPKRINYVFSSKPASEFEGAKGVLRGNVPHALRNLELVHSDKEIMVMGGAEIYAQAFPVCDRIYLTRIDMEVEGDTGLVTPIDYVLDDWSFVLIEEKNIDQCTFQVWKNGYV